MKSVTTQYTGAAPLPGIAPAAAARGAGSGCRRRRRGVHARTKRSRREKRGAREPPRRAFARQDRRRVDAVRRLVERLPHRRRPAAELQVAPDQGVCAHRPAGEVEHVLHPHLDVRSAPERLRQSAGALEVPRADEACRMRMRAVTTGADGRAANWVVTRPGSGPRGDAGGGAERRCTAAASAVPGGPPAPALGQLVLVHRAQQRGRRRAGSSRRPAPPFEHRCRSAPGPRRPPAAR